MVFQSFVLCFQVIVGYIFILISIFLFFPTWNKNNELCVMPASYMDQPLTFHFNFRPYLLIDMSYLLFTRLGSWPTSFMGLSLVLFDFLLLLYFYSFL